MNVENLTKLYQVGQKILRERLPLGFGQIDCGTFACFLGYYWRDTGKPQYIGWAYDEMSKHFALTRKQVEQLFAENWVLHGKPKATDNTVYPGPAAYAELEKRMEYLANLIREAGGTVPGEHSGLPDVVRDIFRLEEAA